MGCVSSRPEYPNEVHPNIFTVTTIAKPISLASGDLNPTTSTTTRDNSTGQLEVTSNELILHRRGHDAIRWPLQYIRRYGYENHLFSFESGRRCESGPGIFTFRCRQARELFAMVQSNVQEARTPPPPASTSAAVGGGDGIPARLRSGSATSQNQFAFPSQLATGGGGSRRSLNEYLAPEPTATLRTTSSMTTTTTATMMNGNQRCGSSNSAVASPRSGNNGTTESQHGQFDDIDSGQVFVEITPLRTNNAIEMAAAPSRQRLLNEERRHRLSSARSRTSSGASDQSLSTTTSFAHQSSSRSRPISFEFILSPTASPPVDGADNAFASPQQSNTSPSASPPSFAYYVNVAPPGSSSARDGVPKRIDCSQRHLSADRQNGAAWRPPARSQSLTSPNAEEQTRYFHLTNGTGGGNNDGAYVNIIRGGSSSTSPAAIPRELRPRNGGGDEPSKITLDYVTLDVGGGGGGGGSGSGNSPAPSPSTVYNRSYHRRQSSHATGVAESASLLVSGKRSSASGLFASSLTSVAEVGSSKCNNDDGSPNNDQISSSSSCNYARIDCTRTKALRETAAAAQMQRHSTSCSASSSEVTIGGGGEQQQPPFRRTRHDSAIASSTSSSSHKVA